MPRSWSCVLSLVLPKKKCRYSRLPEESLLRGSISEKGRPAALCPHIFYQFGLLAARFIQEPAVFEEFKKFPVFSTVTCAEVPQYTAHGRLPHWREKHPMTLR